MKHKVLHWKKGTKAPFPFFSATIAPARLFLAKVFWVLKSLIQVSGPEEGESSVERREQLAKYADKVDLFHTVDSGLSV